MAATDNQRRDKAALSSSSSSFQHSRGVRTTYEATNPNVSVTRRPTQANNHDRDGGVSNSTSTGVSRPFTDNSYRSRFSNESISSAGSPKPTRRKSIFVEELDSDIDTYLTDLKPNKGYTSPAAAAATTTRNPDLASPSPKSQAAQSHSAKVRLKTKQSYMMQLPIQPFRISVLVLLLAAFSTISLSTPAEHDLDGLLKHAPGDEAVMTKRESTRTRIGNPVRNPQKSIPKLETGILVVGIGVLIAGLMA